MQTVEDRRQSDSELIRLIWRWFRHQMAELYKEPPSRTGGLLMGAPLWGMTYIDRFGRYCLPTLCSPKNLAALKELRARLVLFTPEVDLFTLMEAIRPLKGWGIDPVIIEIPPDIMEPMKQHKYQMLGVVHNICLQTAGRHGMSFHMFQPDHLYGPEYFQNLDRISKNADAIIQTGMSANIATAAEEIEKYRQPDKELTIPDRDLGDIGWRHLHKQMKMYCMNYAKIPQKMPNSHYTLWQGRDKVTIYCCHLNPAYIAPSLCEQAKFPRSLGELVSTIDTKLPDLLTGRVYVTEAADGMAFIEVSDDDKPAAPSFVTGPQFVGTCWRQVKFDNKFLPFFQQLCEVPIHPQETFISDKDIKAQHAKLMKMLKSGKARAMEESLHLMIGGI